MAGVINDPSDIKKAQRLLSLLDYAVLADSGVLDDKTKEAVKKARADLKLPMSVNVDDQLLEALSKEYATRGVRNVAIVFGVATLAVGAGLYWMHRKSKSMAEEEYEPEEHRESHGTMVERAGRLYLGEGELPVDRTLRKLSSPSLHKSRSMAEKRVKEPGFYERNKETGMVFGRGLADEAALGLIEPVIEYGSTPEEREAWKQAKERHKLAHVTGRAAGFGASLLYGGGEAKAAVVGGKMAVRGAEKLAVRGAEQAAIRGAEKAAMKKSALSVAARIAKLKAAGISARIAEEIVLRGGEEAAVQTGVQGISKGAQAIGSKIYSS